MVWGHGAATRQVNCIYSTQNAPRFCLAWCERQQERQHEKRGQ